MLAGTLEIQMLANMARLQEDMNKAKGVVGSAMQSVERSVAVAKSALGALGIGLGVGYFVSLVKGSIDAADHLGDLSKTTSITVEMLAGLQLASKQSGGDLDSIAASISKLSVNMGKDSEKFKALGVSAKDPLEAFKQLSDVFVKIQDPQLRAAVAAAALGKSWAGAAPLLAEGSAKIQEMVGNGTRLSGMTTDMKNRADEFNDKMAELNTTLGATRTKMVGDMLPGMNDIAKAMQEAAKDGGPLLTLWVGLGGAMAYLLNITDSQKLKTKLADINDQIEVTRKRLMAGSLNPDGAGRGLFSFLIPDIQLSNDAIKKLGASLAALKQERDKMMPKPTVGAKPTDSKADAALEEAARLFAAGQAAAKNAGAEAARERARLMDLDRRGWIDLADFKVREYEDELAALNKIDEDRNAYSEQMRQLDLKGWVAYAEAIVSKDFELAKQLADLQVAAADGEKKMQADAAQGLHNDVKNALAAAFRDSKDPIRAFGDALGNQIFVSVTNSLADALAKKILGDTFVKGIGSIFGLSFAGGGYTGDGSRSGGLDGMGGFMAMMHPRETVIDHTRPSSNDGGSGGVTIQINATVGDIASKSDVVAGMRATANQIVSKLARSQQYLGAMS